MPDKKPQSQQSNPGKLTEDGGKELTSHTAFLGKPIAIKASQIVLGDVIQFKYNGALKTVFVVNPEWKLKLHGLSLGDINRVTLMNEFYGKTAQYRSPEELYERVLKKEVISKTGSYRTYFVREMSNIYKLPYKIQ